jgi:hypothetical protein
VNRCELARIQPGPSLSRRIRRPRRERAVPQLRHSCAPTLHHDESQSSYCLDVFWTGLDAFGRVVDVPFLSAAPIGRKIRDFSEESFEKNLERERKTWRTFCLGNTDYVQMVAPIQMHPSKHVQDWPDSVQFSLLHAPTLHLPPCIMKGRKATSEVTCAFTVASLRHGL